jgi:hypothetical protein
MLKKSYSEEKKEILEVCLKKKNLEQTNQSCKNPFNSSEITITKKCDCKKIKFIDLLFKYSPYLSIEIEDLLILKQMLQEKTKKTYPDQSMSDLKNLIELIDKINPDQENNVNGNQQKPKTSIDIKESSQPTLKNELTSPKKIINHKKEMKNTESSNMILKGQEEETKTIIISEKITKSYSIEDEENETTPKKLRIFEDLKNKNTSKSTSNNYNNQYENESNDKDNSISVEYFAKQVSKSSEDNLMTSNYNNFFNVNREESSDISFTQDHKLFQESQNGKPLVVKFKFEDDDNKIDEDVINDSISNMNIDDRKDTEESQIIPKVNNIIDIILREKISDYSDSNYHESNDNKILNENKLNFDYPLHGHMNKEDLNNHCNDNYIEINENKKLSYPILISNLSKEDTNISKLNLIDLDEGEQEFLDEMEIKEEKL